MRIKPDDIKAGTIFYESVAGHSIRFQALEEPHTTEVVIREGEEPRRQWHWQAKNIQTSQVTDFTVTSGLEHYGPKIYSEPAYWSP